MAEDVRFELTVPGGTAPFQDAAIDHSANLPCLAPSSGFEPDSFG